MAQLTGRLYEMGCYEVSLGDTIGIGDPGSMEILMKNVLTVIPLESVAIHCHDTYGMALANVYVALKHGVTVFDSSVGGLGGCPFAPGASGNVATEDLVYMFDKLGIHTGVNFQALMKTGLHINSLLGRNTTSKIVQALITKEACKPK